MNFLRDYSLWSQALIFGSILIGVTIIFGILIPVLKPTIKKSSAVYLYSFASGFFIVLAIYGLIHEALELLEPNYGDLGALGLTIIAAVLGIGVLIGMSAGLISRYVVAKRAKELHADHSAHPHDDFVFNVNDIDNPKSKWVAIYLLLTHRLVVGLTLGILVFDYSQNQESTIALTLILGFIFHFIPEILIVYYRQREAGVSQWRAILNSTIFKVVMIPLILMGAYIAKGVNGVAWLVPLLIAISGGAIAFTSIFELIPEFLHQRQDGKNNWVKIALLLIIGFVLAVIILTFH